MSFSLFVWHQIVIAFYRYYVSHELSLFFVLAYLGVVFGISFFTYYFIEKKIRLTKRVILTTVAFNVLAAGMGFYVFLTSGIIRDVPELDLQKKPFFEHVSSVKSYRLNGNHGQYCDRIYAYENRTYTLEETTEPKARVLVLGNSFARDMGNVLLESSSANKILLSYIYYDNNTSLTDNSLQIIHNSDTIFVFMSKSDLPQHFWETLSPEARVYGIGTKNYGQSLGAVYRKRYLSDYYDQTVAMAAGYEALNVSWKSEWGDHYIDFMSPVTTKFGRVRVFTDDHRFISQDCIHLTQAGAKYYARILDIDRLIFGDPL